MWNVLLIKFQTTKAVFTAVCSQVQLQYMQLPGDQSTDMLDVSIMQDFVETTQGLTMIRINDEYQNKYIIMN